MFVCRVLAIIQKPSHLSIQITCRRYCSRLTHTPLFQYFLREYILVNRETVIRQRPFVNLFLDSSTPFVNIIRQPFLVERGRFLYKKKKNSIALKELLLHRAHNFWQDVDEKKNDFFSPPENSVFLGVWKNDSGYNFGGRKKGNLFGNCVELWTTITDIIWPLAVLGLKTVISQPFVNIRQISKKPRLVN